MKLLTVALSSWCVLSMSSLHAQPAKPGGVPTQKHPGMVASYPVIAADSCTGHGVAVVPSKVSTTRTANGDLETRTAWGCGCPSGPVFTLAYVPRSSPLQVRLCFDAAKDTCERGCGMAVRWNLAEPLREAKTTTIKVVP